MPITQRRDPFAAGSRLRGFCFTNAVLHAFSLPASPEQGRGSPGFSSAQGGDGERVFFRFAAALILVVLISMAGIGLEKQTLEMKRAVSRQYFQKDLLLEMHAKLRLQIQQLTAPSNLAAHTEWNEMPREAERRMPAAVPSGDSVPEPRQLRLPLMKWQHPAPFTQ